MFRDYSLFNSSVDYQNHLDSVQNDLECLKDLLRTDSLSLDTNALLGVSLFIYDFKCVY